jgi:universal stress protein A
MNTKKIIFPTDFSHLSDAALAQATALARDSNGLLLIVHVQELPAIYGEGSMYYGLPEPDLGALKKMLAAVVPDDPKVRYEHRLLFGSPAEELVGLAQREKADLIVMSTHGRTGLKRLLMGSVAEVVVRKAPCPVLSFRAAAAEKAAV